MTVHRGMIRHEKRDPLSGLTLYHYQHNSGFDLTVLPKAGFATKYVGFAIPCGSSALRFRDRLTGEETTVPPGTAHMLEHVIFRRNVEDDPEAGILSRLTDLGIDANAYTSNTHMLFYFTCAESAKEGMVVLYDAILNPSFNPQDIESERKIIRSELAVYFDEPENQAYQQVLENLYHEHPVKHDIAGSADSLKEITREHLQALHRTFFTQANISLVVVGDVDSNEIVDALANVFEEEQPDEHIRAHIPTEPVQAAVPESVMHGQVVNPLFVIGWKDPQVSVENPLNGSQLGLRQLAGQLYFDTLIGDSSTLYEELSDEGLIDESFEFAYVCERDFAYLVISGESLDAKRSASEISRRLTDLIRSGDMNGKAFEIQKRALTGRFIRSMDDIEACGSTAVGAALNHIDLFDYPMLFERIDYDRTVEAMDFVTVDGVQTIVTLLPSSPL